MIGVLKASAPMSVLIRLRYIVIKSHWRETVGELTVTILFTAETRPNLLLITGIIYNLLYR